MAHACPECYADCHCGGDLDDLCWGDDSEEAMKCTHYTRPECSAYDDPDDDCWPENAGDVLEERER